MQLTRRQLFAALAAGWVLEPDGEIWRPGERLISVPKPPRYRIEGIGDVFRRNDGRYVVNGDHFERPGFEAWFNDPKVNGSLQFVDAGGRLLVSYLDEGQFEQTTKHWGGLGPPSFEPRLPWRSVTVCQYTQFDSIPPVVVGL